MSTKLIKKLDRRHTGYGIWKYYINKRIGIGTRDNSNQEFYRWRDWCWQNWGGSKELLEWISDYNKLTVIEKVSCQNPNWCWFNDRFNSRIYLRTDEELTMFILKWNVK